MAKATPISRRSVKVLGRDTIREARWALPGGYVVLRIVHWGFQ